MNIKTDCILIVIGMLGFVGPVDAKFQMNVQEITSSAPIIKGGRLFSVEATVNTKDLGRVYIPGLVYMNDGKKICPLGDIQLVENILTDEGFTWRDDRDSVRILIRTILLLYEGRSGRSLIDKHYYVARLLPGAADTDALQRLQKACAEPKLTVENGRWNIVLYQIRECIGECPVQKYSFSGTTSPFGIDVVHIEHAVIVPSIILKEPLPR